MENYIIIIYNNIKMVYLKMKFKSNITIKNNEIIFCYKCGTKLEKHDEYGWDLFKCPNCGIEIHTTNEIFCSNYEGYVNHKGFREITAKTDITCPKCQTKQDAYGYQCSCGQIVEINYLQCPECNKINIEDIIDLDEFELLENLEEYDKEQKEITTKLEEKYAYATQNNKITK